MISLTVTCLVLILVVTPLIGFTKAEKTTIQYQATQRVTEVAGTVNEKWSQDGHTCIRTGNERVGVYNGPLGTGTWYSTNIVSITWLDIPPSTPFTFGIGVVAHGFGIYRVLLVIDSGPYGSGTLQGTNHLYWDEDLRLPASSMHYNVWGTLNLQGGTGDLKGITLDATSTQNALKGQPTQFTGELTLP